MLINQWQNIQKLKMSQLFQCLCTIHLIQFVQLLNYSWLYYLKKRNYKEMQKNKGPILFEIAYSQVNGTQLSNLGTAIALLLHFVSFSYLLYNLVDHNFINQQNLPFEILTLSQFIALIVFTILTLVSFWKGILKGIWGYFLLFLEGLSTLYFETMINCLTNGSKCSKQYQIINLISIVYYTIVVIGLRTFYYYPFSDSMNILSMKQKYIIVYLYIYKIMLSVLNNIEFLKESESKHYLVFILTITVFFVFQDFGFRNSYISRAWILLSSYIIWTSTIIFFIPFLRLIEEQLKFNQLKLFKYIWGYTMPFIFIFSLLAKKNNLDWKDLFRQEQHFISDKIFLLDLCSQLKKEIFKLKKSQLKNNDPLFKEVWELINAHNQFCLDIYCPLQCLKNIKVVLEDDFLEQKRLVKSIQCCLEFGRYYLEKLHHENPNEVDLMIELSNYDMDAFHNRQSGLILCNQFNGKENSISQRYALFFLKRKIQLVDLDNENSHNNSQDDITQFRHNIQVSVTMLAQFWYFLGDPKCNLTKLYELANLLFPLKLRVDSDWKKIKRLKNIQSYHLYARYLIRMFNDKETGVKILEQAAKIEDEIRNRQEIDLGVEDSNKLAEENGIIFLQFDGVNSGVMFQVNLAAEKIFGYKKGELISRKVNDIMPILYAQHHDKILQHYQQTNKSTMMNKQRHIWGKSKNGYLFPFTILIKPVKNYYSQTSEVYASIHRDIWLKETGIIILDLDQNISQISSAILGIFPKIQNKLSENSKVNIRQFLEDYDQIMRTCFNDFLQYQYKIAKRLESEDNTIIEISYGINLEIIKFTISGQVGTMIKIAKISGGLNKATVQTKLSKLNSSSLKEIQTQGVKISNFQFSMSIQKSIKGDQQSQDVISFSGSKKRLKSQYLGIFSVQSINKFFTTTKTMVNLFSKIKDYTGDIKIKRLQNSLIKEIHDQSENQSFNQAEIEVENQDMLTPCTIRPNQLSSILQRQSRNSIIFLLKLFTVIVLILGSTLYLIQYLYTVKYHKNLILGLKEYTLLEQLNSQVLYLKAYISYFTSFNSTHQKLDKLTSQVSELDQLLDEFKFNVNVPVKYSDSTSQSLLLNFALNKLVSEANSLKSLPMPLNTSTSNVFFVNYNTINGIKMGLDDQKMNIFTSYIKIINTIKQNNIGFFVGCLINVILFIIIRNILLNSVLKRKAKTLQIFFQIPRKSCNDFQKQCQIFIQKLSIEDQDNQINSLISDEQEEQGLNSSKKSNKQKKRTIVGEDSTVISFIITSFVLLLILTMFHLFVIIRLQNQKEKVLYIGQKMAQIFETQQVFATFINSKNSFLVSPQIPIFNSSDHMKIITQKFQDLDYHVVHLFSLFFHLKSVCDFQFQMNVNNLLYGNLCQKKPICIQSQNNGINSILLNYRDMIKISFEKLKQITQDGQISEIQKLQVLNISLIERQNSFQALVKKYFRQFSQIALEGAQRFVMWQNTLFFGAMLLVTLFNFSCLLVKQITFYNELEQKIVATEYILTFIPIDEINKNVKIAKYIRSQILHKN